MDEEALKDAHAEFVKGGYKGDINSFKELMATNKDALNDAHNNFAKQGYSGSVDDFSTLIGVKKKDFSKATSTTQSTNSASVQSNGSLGTPNSKFPTKQIQLKETAVTEKDNTAIKPFRREISQKSIAQDDEVVKQKVKQLTNASKPYTQISPEKQVKIDEDYVKASTKTGFVNKLKQFGTDALNAVASGMNKIGMIDEVGDLELEDPLKKAKEKTLKDAQEQGLNLNKTQFDDAVKQNFIQNRKDEVLHSQLNDFNRNLTPEDRGLLLVDRHNKHDNLDSSQKELLQNTQILKHNREQDFNDYTSVLSDIDKYATSGQEVPQELAQKKQELESNLNTYNSQIDKNYQKFNSNKKNIGTFDQEISVYNTEGNDFLNFIGHIKNATKKIGADSIDFMAYLAKVGVLGTPQSANEVISNTLHNSANLLNQNIENSNEHLKQTTSVESPLDFVNKTIDVIADNVPLILGLTATGGVGVAGMGMNMAGEEFGKMQNENAKNIKETGKEKYNSLQTALIPLAWGGTVLAPMATQLKTIQNGARVLTAIERETPDLIEKSLKEKVSKMLSDTKAFGKDSFKLGNDLKVMGVLQEGINHYGLGKKVDYDKLTDLGVYAEAPIMHGMAKVSPMLLGLTVKPFMSDSDVKTMDANSAKIFDLNKKLENPNLEKEERDILTSTIDNIAKNSKDLIDKKITSIANTPKEVQQAIVEKTLESSKMRDQAQRIKVSDNLNQSQKEITLSNLEQRYADNEAKRVQLISGDATVLDVLPENKVIKLQDQAGRELMKEKNPDGKKVNVKIDSKEINERAIKIYNEQQAIKDAEAKIPTSETKSKAEVPQQAEAEKVNTEPKNTTTEPTTVVSDNKEVSPTEDVVATSVEKKQPTNAKEWEEQNFTKDEIEERRKFGLTPEQEWEPTFRGTSLSEWEDIQKGGDFKSEGLNGLVFTTPSAELAKQSGKGVDAEVIIEFKPESKSKMREGDSKYDSKEYYGDGLNKEDVLRVTDKNGNVIYEATSTTNNPANGNLSTRTSNVGESGNSKQESPTKENLPSSVERGKSKNDVEVDIKTPIEKAIEDKSGVYYLNGEQGEVKLDGQTVVFETKDKIIELGNKEDLTDSSVEDFDINHEKELDFKLNNDNSIEINGKKYVNNYSNPESAFSQDKNGNYSVSLETENGQKRTFRGQQADQIVYQTKLKNFEQNATEKQVERGHELADEIVRAETETTKYSPKRENKSVRKAEPRKVTPKIKEVATVEEVVSEKPTEIGESKTDVPKKEIGAEKVNKPFEGEQGKSSILKRISEGGNSAEVNKTVEDIGLNYTVRKQDQVYADAVNFVDKVGIVEAYNAIKNNLIQFGDSVSVIYAEIVDRLPAEIEKELSKVTDVSEREKLQKEYNDLQEKIYSEFSARAIDLGQANSILNYIYNKNTAVKYSLANQIKEFKNINSGEIDAETLDKFKKLDKEYKEAIAKIADLEKIVQEANEQKDFENIVEEETRTKANKPSKKKTAENAIKALDKFEKSLLKNTYSDATLITPILIQGVRLTKASIKAGMAVSEAVEKGIEQIKKEIEKLGKTFDSEDKFRKDLQDALGEAVVKEDKVTVDKNGNLKIPMNIIKDYISKGGTDLAELSEQIHETIKDEFPNIDVRDIREKIAGIGKTSNKTKTQLETDITNLKRVERLKLELEDLQKGIAKAKNPVRKQKLSSTQKKLKAQIKALQDALGITEEQRTQNSINYTKRRISELKEKIENRDYSKKEIKPIEENTELKQLKIEKNRIQEEFDTAKYKKELENRSAKDRIKDFAGDMWDSQRVTRATGELSFVGAQGGFYMVDSTFSRKTLANLVKNFKGTTLEDWKKSPMKTLAKIVKSAHSAESIIEMFNKMGTKNNYDDFQKALKEHPDYDLFLKSGLRVLGEDVKTQVKDEMFIGNHLLNILKLPFRGITHLDKGTKRTTLQGYYEKLKTGKVSEKNKKNVSEMFDAVNPLSVFERGNNTFINMARVEMFEQGAEILKMQGKNPIDHIQDYKDLASAVNTVTGSANLNQTMTMAVPILNKLIFSTRFWASSLNMMSPITPYYLLKLGNYENITANPKSWKNFKPSVAQKTFVKPMVKGMVAFYGLATLTVALINGAIDDDDELTDAEKKQKKAYIEYDPRSSDFMQVVSGNTRTDFFGNTRSNVVLFSKLFSRQTKKQSGEVVDNGTEFGSKTNFDIFANYVSNKANPFVGMFIQNMKGHREDVTNEKTGKVEQRVVNGFDNEDLDIRNQTINNMLPIFYDTTKDILEEDPPLGSAFYITMSALGKQTSVYNGQIDKFVKEQNDRAKEPTFEETFEKARKSDMSKYTTNINLLEDLVMAKNLGLTQYISEKGEKIPLKNMNWELVSEAIEKQKELKEKTKNFPIPKQKVKSPD